jgi:hypothetical protein
MRTMFISVIVGLSVAVVIAAAAGRAAERTISFESLLDEMVDRNAAARFPDPAYTCRQASSYDRASVSPDDPGSWMANNDRSFFIRSERNDGREEWVMLDAKGPGCVVRFWTTSGNPIGTVRYYIDGADEPVINEPCKRLVGGDALVGPPLSKVRARGMNLYLPIPYAKHCKITYDRPNFHVSKNQDDLLYYQINYRTYEAGAQVESFSREALEAAGGKIAKLQKALLEPAVGTLVQRRRPTTKILRPNRSTMLDGLIHTESPHAVCRLAVRLRADDLAAATRSTVLSIQFDKEKAVWCPVGDFFGSGVGLNPYRGWWRTVDRDGWMTCYWVMPFEKTCLIEFHNFGRQDVELSWQSSTRPWGWDDRSMYFHTTWRQEYPIDTSTKHDWNYVEIGGKGVYMGDTLCMNNPNEIWWGEGDEKIYVDGEKFPSHFGTGTEDYYGYAWCTPEFFESPFHSQPRAEGPRNKGHVTNTRVRLLDGIPFTRRLRFDMEVWHWRPCNVAYAATTYWYGRPGAKANYGPMPEMAWVIVAEPFKPRKVEGALEGEDLRILVKPGGVIEIQETPQFKWSGSKQLWWRDGKPGDKLVLGFAVEKAGRYTLTAALTKAVDYGIVRLTLDETPLGEPLDLFNNAVTTKTCPLGTHQLSAGQHQLTVEITGSNPKAVQRHMFGLDYLKLDPAE